MIVTRFAPSPTGFLHVGGARTALFNWLFARHHEGNFFLRIEDTDRARSKEEAIEAIFDGLTWLGLKWDGKPVFQSKNAARHVEIAQHLLKIGAAYRCYATQEEIETERKIAQAEGKALLFSSKWRDGGVAPPSPDAPFVIRLKAPRAGNLHINDAVQGAITWQNKTLDDMVLVRSDGTPTYMLAVAVDDHDMGVTHIIRGDDHLNNAARQSLLYDAMGWSRPIFAHIPLIYGMDGKKLSKRYGALGVDSYRALGYPSQAVCNALARLGWSHGDAEFFTMDEARAWFSLDKIGRGGARIDFDKIAHLSARHIAVMDNENMMVAIDDFLKSHNKPVLNAQQKQALLPALYCLKPKAKTILSLLDLAHFVLSVRPIVIDEKSKKMLDGDMRARLNHVISYLADSEWNKEALERSLKKATEDREEKFGQFAGALRVALAGRTVTPSVFDMLIVLGKKESLLRISETKSS